MPYVLRSRGAQTCVHVQNADGSPGAIVSGGCHDTRQQAEYHMRALYRNVSDARTASTHDCGCDHALDETVYSPMQAATTGPMDEGFPVPAYPPADWFTERPEWLSPDTKIGVDDQGRVAGYFYNAGQCLVHDSSACPSPSPTGYAAFHQQEVVVDTGEAVRVGVIGNVNGHASPFARVDVAQAHYADPDRQLIVCRAYDDEHGGYILGAVVPHATYGDVALVRRSALSGDWRPMPAAWWQAHQVPQAAVASAEGFDCIGPTLVTRPGLPLVRRFDGGEFVHQDRGRYRAAAMLGGLGGVQYQEERRMAETRVDLPGGVTVTTSQPEDWGEPGPHPAAPAVQAAVEPEVDESVDPSLADVLAEVRALAARIDATDARIASMASTFVASMDPGEPAMPEEADAPFPGGDVHDATA